MRGKGGNFIKRVEGKGGNFIRGEKKRGGGGGERAGEEKEKKC